jgi:hypothetical protein
MAWCPSFRVAEGELAWDRRVIQDFRMVECISPPRLAPQDQGSENRGRYMMGREPGAPGGCIGWKILARKLRVDVRILHQLSVTFLIQFLGVKGRH